MAVSLKHAFQSAKADGPDSTQVQPSNWNAEHVLTMATARLLGRTTAGTGAVEEVSVHSSLSLSAGVLALATNPTVGGNLTVSGTINGTSGVLTGSLGVGGSPATSAALEIQSTTKGFLFPRMTTTQRDAIASPVAGLTIYNSTTGRLEVYASGAWGPVLPIGVGGAQAHSARLQTISDTGLTTAEVAPAALVTAAEGIGSNNNDTTLPSSGAVKAYVDGQALGVGQTWQNVLASRSTGTDYTNTTGRPIMVNITFTQTSSSVPTTQLLVGGVVVAQGGQSGIAGGGTLSAVVPAGAVYRCITSGNAPSLWAELR